VQHGATTTSREVGRNATTHDDHYRAAKAIEKASGRRSRSRRDQQFGPQDYEVV
jgi:transposase, IS30 family